MFSALEFRMLFDCYIACLYSMTGKIEESIYYLNKAVEAGFAYRLYLERDGDFDPIRSHPQYQALIKKLTKREKDAGV